eukprot:5957165-Amphidinium_carterae.1
MGSNQSLVQKALEHFTQKSLLVHEVVNACPVVDLLGYRVNGLEGTVTLKPERWQRVVATWTWVSKGHKLSPLHMQRLLGHTVP